MSTGEQVRPRNIHKKARDEIVLKPRTEVGPRVLRLGDDSFHPLTPSWRAPVLFKNAPDISRRKPLLDYPSGSLTLRRTEALSSHAVTILSALSRPWRAKDPGAITA